MKDYYYIRGIDRSAAENEIKTAYRKLSLKFHPDKNDGGKYSENRFREINEAYETLSNIDRKREYDRSFVSSSISSQFEEKIKKKYEEELKKKEEEIKRKYQTPEQRAAEEAEKRKKQEENLKREREQKLCNEIIQIEKQILENHNLTKNLNAQIERIKNDSIVLNERLGKIKMELKSFGANNTRNEKNKLFIYETDKGTISVEQGQYYDQIDPGKNVYKDGSPAPSGKYRLGFMWYVHIENGIVKKTTAF